MANDLTLSVLTMHDGEARIRDLQLAASLAMTDPHSVRRIIERNRSELSTYGEVSDVASETSKLGGRPGRSYLLNEAQALLVCMFARTPNAAAVRRQVVEVFLEWRRTQAAPPARPPELTGLEERLARIERQMAERAAVVDRSYAEALANFIEGARFGEDTDGLHLGPVDLRVFVASIRRSAWMTHASPAALLGYRGFDVDLPTGRKPGRVRLTDEEAILRKIEAVGSRGIQRFRLTQSLTNRFSAAEMDRVLGRLIEADAVRVHTRRGPNGRNAPIRRYILGPNAKTARRD